MGRPRLERPNYRLERNQFGIFEVRWTENRKPRSVSTRTRDEGEARKQFDQFLAGVDSIPIPDNPTIGQIIDHYLADRAGHTASKGHEWALKPVKRLVGNLKPEQVERRTYWKRRTLEGVSAGTIIKEVGHLRAALALAVKDRLIREAPHLDRPSQPPSREIWLSKTQARRLTKAAIVPHVRLFIVLGLATGSRKEALESLTWDRVDFIRGIIHLEPPGRPTSNKRNAIVPIEPEIIAELARQYEVRASDYVIEWRGKPVKDIKKGFAAAVRRAGLPDTITPHILRHSVATWMVEANISDEEVARFIGDTPEMIRKVYGHHRPGYLRRGARALSLQATPKQTT